MRALPILLLITAMGLAGSAMAQTAATAPKNKGVWEPVNYGEDLTLRDVFFVTPDIGYVAGDAGTILKTTDAGASWTALLGGDPQSQERAIMQLWFVSPTVGWAAQVTGTHTNLFRTTDGETWSRIGQIPEHYQDFAFSSATNGVYVHGKDFFHTRDAGKTWRNSSVCATKAEIGGLPRQVECELFKVRFVSPTVAYALGSVYHEDAAVVLKSEDSGETWTVLAVIEGDYSVQGGLYFVDENVGYFSTTYAKSSYRTVDGGLTWTGMPATAIYRRIIFADPDVGWAMQRDQLSYTTDGGKRWFSRTIAFPATVNAFSLPRRDRAYAVGEHGMIYRYSVVPAATPVAAKALVATAMPALDNGVLTQLAQLDTRIDKLGAEVQASGAAAGADWTTTPAGQQLLQIQTTVEAVAGGVPAMGRKHRSLNLLPFGLTLLSDLTAEASSLKEAFASLRQSRDLNSVSAALQSLNGQIDAMKTSVETFTNAGKPGG